MTAETAKKRKSVFRRFRSNDRGATAVEFALLAGPFLYLLLVIFETAVMLFSEYIIENGVAQASRQIRTGQAQISGMTGPGFKTLVCSQMPSYLGCSTKLTVDVRKFSTFAAVSLPAPLDGGGNLSGSLGTYQSSGPMDVVVVRAYYPWELTVPGISMLANMSGNKRLLTAGTTFRNEPYVP